MKKILFTIFTAAIFTSFLGAQDFGKTKSRNQISGALEKTTDLISEILPENSSLLGTQPDAFIGKFIPSIPMHFTAGTSFSGTFIKTETLKDAMTDLSNGISGTLKSGNATDDFNISFDLPANWSDTIKVQCLNCRKTKEYGNEKVRSKFQGRGIEALGRHWNQESLRTA